MRKVFSIVYFFFSILIILFTFNDVINFEIESLLKIFSFFLAILLFLFYREDDRLKKICNNDYVIFFLIVCGIIIRIILLFLDYGNLFADYANFHGEAIYFFKGKGITKYTATFPHLIPYVVVLGSLFKVFGVNYKVVVGLNIIFDLLASFVLGKYFEDKKISLLWLFNPINVLWCGMCHPVVITNSLLVISFVLLINVIKYIDKNDSNKKLYINVIFFSILLSIANLFRPIMVIVLIAFVIFLLFKVNNKNIYKYLIVVVSCLMIYFCCNDIYFRLERKFISSEVASSTVGWNLYVGSNIDSTGTWNIEQQSLFAMVFDDMTPTEIQEYFLDKSIDNYKKNGLLNNLKLFWDKSIILMKNPSEFSCLVFDNSLSLNMDRRLFYLIYFISYVFHYILLIINLVISYLFLKNKKIDNSFLLQLFIIGVVSSHLFVEVSVRYSMPLFVGYILIVIINREKLVK